MAYRFQRRIKICKGVHLNLSKSGVGISLGVRGASISMGPRGTYINTGLPGTGLSYRQKINSSSTHYDTSNLVERDYEPGSTYQLLIDNDGNETFLLIDPNGNPFTNDLFLRRIKRTSEYKEIVEKARKSKFDYLKKQNDDTVYIYKSTPKIITEEDVISEKNDTSEIKQKYYRVKRFEMQEPNQSALYDEAFKWAISNTKNAKFWNRKKLTDEATLNKLRELFNNAKNDWISKKNAFLEQEKANKEKFDKEYAEEYKKEILERNNLYDIILNPDDNYLSETISDVLKTINLPVDFSIDYAVSNKNIILDLDLPEIEDFPQIICSFLSSGKLSIKKKTVSDLNKDYATSVIGMAFFFAGILFNISPKIENIQIAGYTQRLNKKSGNTEDQYVYSINFSRTSFSTLNMQNIDPLEAITNFEHSIDISSKYELKTIRHDRLIDTTNLSEGENRASSDSSPSNDLNNVNSSNEGDFCYSPQQVIDDYNSDFECYYLRPDVIESKKRENKKTVMKKIFWSLLVIAIVGLSCFYYFSHADERKFKKTVNELLSRNNISLIEARLHTDSIYYYLYSNSENDISEVFLSSFYSLYKEKNPVILVLKKNSSNIIRYIDAYYSLKKEIPTSEIIDCADALALAFNIDANQVIVPYPLKETSFYKDFMEEKRIQEELAAKEENERAARQSKIRANNYLYTRTKPEIHHAKINRSKGAKNYTKSKNITVKYVYAYCPKGQSSSQLIDDIRNMEKTSYIRIYIYSEKYSSYEIQKGEIDWHKDYKYVKEHRIAEWFFD